MSLVVRGLALSVIVGGLAVAMWRLEEALAPPEVAVQVRPATESVPELADQPLPPASTDARADVLLRSPFAPTRAPFTRNAPVQPAQAPVDVRVTAITRSGEDLRATLIFNGQEVTVMVGDETPLGAVRSIAADAVVLAGPPERRVGLFD